MYKYCLDKQRRRVMCGLTVEETREFELLDAALALDAKPVNLAPDPLPEDLRWFELLSKHEAAIQLERIH